MNSDINVDILQSKYNELKTGITELMEVNIGYLSKNFEFNSGNNRFFLKCYRYSDSRRIEDAHKAKFFFAVRGIPIILPINNIEGNTITKIGDKYFSLLPFIDGFQYISDNIDIPESIPYSLGKMLGHIHKAGESNYPDISEKFKPWDKELFNKTADMILSIINNINELTDFDINAREAVKFKKECVEKEKVLFENMAIKQIGLIHGDYHDGNVFFNKEDEISSVFDLEKACLAPFSYEVIRAIQYSHCTGYDRAGFEKQVEDFLNGYRSEKNISSDELQEGRELFYQKAIHGLWVEEEHYLRSNFKNDSLLQTKEFIASLEELRKSS